VSLGIFLASSSIWLKRSVPPVDEPKLGALSRGGAGAASAGRTIVPDSSIHTELGMLITPKSRASR